MHLRQFIAEADGQIYRLPNKVYAQMMDGTGAHRRPELAGKRVRVAEVLFKVDDKGKPTQSRAIYNRILFDKHGNLDVMDCQRAAAELVGGMLGQLPKKTKRHLERTHLWKPDKQLEEQIFACAFGLLPCPLWTNATRHKDAAVAARRVMALRTSREPAESSWQDDIGSAAASFDSQGIEDSRNRSMR